MSLILSQPQEDVHQWSGGPLRVVYEASAGKLRSREVGGQLPYEAGS